MRNFVSNIEIAEMLGDWYLVASTNGHFDSHPRVEGADLSFTRSRRSILFQVIYRTPRRSWKIRGRVPERMSTSGVYNWRGSGGWLLASRLAWGLARSDDGLVVAAHNPGTMLTNEGLVILARVGTSAEEAEATIRRNSTRLFISRKELQELSWRVGKNRMPGLPTRTRWWKLDRDRELTPV